MPTLVQEMDQSSWMTSNVAYIPTSYLSVTVEQSCPCPITVCTLLMLVWAVKVIKFCDNI